MSEPLFDIVFYGIIQPGKDRAEVMVNMAQLFKTDAAKIKPYFSGDRKVIKSKCDELTAEKYRVALENVGLVIKLEEVEQAEPAAAGSTGDGAAASSAEPAPDTSGISMAEVGADVVEHPVEVTPQPIGDISDITMAEVGADVVEHPVEVTPQPIDDISDITMAEVGADVVENPVEKTPQPIGDISDISLAEVGADVYEKPPEHPEEPEIDISGLAAEEEK